MLQKNKVIKSEFIIDRDKQKTFFIDVDFIRRSIKCYLNCSIEKGKSKAQTSALLRKFENVSGHTDQIFFNAYYNYNKCNKSNASLETLLSQKNDGDPYSIIDNRFEDVIKHFEIFTEDRIGSDFGNSKNFVIRLEDFAERFVNQVVANL